MGDVIRPKEKDVILYYNYISYVLPMLNHKIEQSMKKVTLFVGMIAMAAFLSTTAVAQDKAKDTKPATTQPSGTDARVAGR